MLSEAQKRANDKFNKKYQKERTKCINLRFFPADMNLYEFAKSHDNVNGYIKDLIRADMEKNAQK